ncbi:MAG: hypothetical protein V1702_00310 [Candidatus Woesearchaeota archaeon]
MTIKFWRTFLLFLTVIWISLPYSLRSKPLVAISVISLWFVLCVILIWKTKLIQQNYREIITGLSGGILFGTVWAFGIIWGGGAFIDVVNRSALPKYAELAATFFGITFLGGILEKKQAEVTSSEKEIFGLSVIFLLSATLFFFVDGYLALNPTNSDAIWRIIPQLLPFFITSAIGLLIGGILGLLIILIRKFLLLKRQSKI